jgi:signal peptidase I
VAHFALASVVDWVASATKERIADSPAALARQARAVWAAGRHRGPRHAFAEWGAAILIYLFVSTTLVQAYVIPTGSMEGNLKIGDHILVDRLAYADPGSVGGAVLPYRDVERGDIVAFLYPEDPRQTFVKRAIGLPGDRIRMENQQVTRNGRRLIEPYAQHTAPFADDYRDNFPAGDGYGITPRGLAMLDQHVVNGELVVPEGTLFMLGDNRDNSLDSRYWGLVPREYVVGKPLFVYWSYDAPTADLQEWTVHHVLDVALHFFSKTRWERTFLIPGRQEAGEAAP